MAFSALQISEVAVPQWIGQSKGYDLFRRKMEEDLVFDYGSYQDHGSPYLNGILRTFNVHVGRAW